MGQNFQLGREVWNVDDNDVTSLGRDDAAGVGLGEAEDDLVTVGVGRKDFSGAGKSANLWRKNEPVPGLVEDWQVVVDVVDVDDNFQDDVQGLDVGDFEFVPSVGFEVENETGDQVPVAVVVAFEPEIGSAFATPVLVVQRRQRQLRRRRERRQDLVERSVEKSDGSSGRQVFGDAAEQSRDRSTRLDSELNRNNPDLTVQLFADGQAHRGVGQVPELPGGRQTFQVGQEEEAGLRRV